MEREEIIQLCTEPNYYFSKSNGGLNRFSEDKSFLTQLRDYDSLPKISTRPQTAINRYQKNNSERLSAPKISLNPYDAPSYFMRNKKSQLKY